MVSANHTLTQKRLKELLNYDQLTGIFTWLISRGPAKAGRVAGTAHHTGYMQTNISGKAYQNHRLAFLWMDGVFPKYQVDHINHKRNDNRWLNLRRATRHENSKNRIKPSTNKSGIIGVAWHKPTKKWRAAINTGYKQKHLGLFDDIIEAGKVRKAAEIEYGYHENHGK